MHKFTKYPSSYIRAAKDSELALFQSDFWYFLGDCIDGVFDAIEQRKHIVNRDLDEFTKDIIVECEDGTYYRLPYEEYSEVFQYAYDTYGEDYDKCTEALLGVVAPYDPNGKYRLGKGKPRLSGGKYRLGNGEDI